MKLTLVQGLRGEVVDNPRAKGERVARAFEELEDAIKAALGPDARVLVTICGAFGGDELPTPPASSRPVLRVVREAA